MSWLNIGTDYALIKYKSWFKQYALIKYRADLDNMHWLNTELIGQCALIKYRADLNSMRWLKHRHW